MRERTRTDKEDKGMDKEKFINIIIMLIIIIITIIIGTKIKFNNIINNIKVVDFLDDDKIILNINNDIKIYDI